MFSLDKRDTLFVVWAFTLQIILIIHFAIRKRFFENYTVKYGWIMYALSVPAVVISVLLLLSGKSWSFWLGGFLFLIFAAFGYYIDYIKQIPWRNPIVPRVMFPYVTLYLSTVMFYWWPLGLIDRRLWFAFLALFIISTILNITSH